MPRTLAAELGASARSLNGTLNIPALALALRQCEIAMPAFAFKHNAGQNRGAYSLKIPVTKTSLDGHVKEATEILILLRRVAICLNQRGFKVSEMLSKPL